MFKEMSFSTHKKVEVINIDSELAGLKLEGNGLLHVFTPHATAALILNEAENGLMQDFEERIKSGFQGDWKHDRIDGNASAHLASGVLGQSVTLPVKNGELVKGSWQNLLYIELDGPRTQRRIIFQYLKI